jgi:hypothetical protein
MKHERCYIGKDRPDSNSSEQRPEWFQRSLDQLGKLQEVWNERLTLENLPES